MSDEDVPVIIGDPVPNELVEHEAEMLDACAAVMSDTWDST